MMNDPDLFFAFCVFFLILIAGGGIAKSGCAMRTVAILALVLLVPLLLLMRCARG